ncbi:PIN domain-containing protein [Pyrodictium abyssi]|uniref:PIN domain-containing protein n=1 Tax=Pyrodictium abyssi TaxID=54256 RepID=A0ABM8IYX1_9CREN|nr:hypothetical protein PABY_14180 [Pyrodictium abyssi]
MIIDTTYILPLAGIGVKADLLRAAAEGSARVSLDELKLSMISLFELQAKAAKLGIPPERVTRAVRVILRSFEVVPFYRGDVIEHAHILRSLLRDYIDCVVVATAAALGEDLVTEDRDIHAAKKDIESRYGIDVLSYRDLVPG